MPQKKPQGQWRGLDTLFLENSVDEAVTNQKTTLRIGLLEPKSTQPRKTFEAQPLEQLAASISVHGILQPILVRELPNGKYQIVAGERRWRAAKLAGLAEVPVIIIEGDDREAAEIALVENVQRGGELAGGIPDLNAHNVDDLDQVSVFGKHPLGRYVIVYDQSENAEILGLRNGKSSEVDIVLGEDIRY